MMYLLLLALIIPSWCHAESASHFANSEKGVRKLFLAQVTLTENPAKKVNHQKPKSKPKKSDLYEIDGYVDGNYVRIVVEVESNQYINGNLYDKKGNASYVSGELINGVFHLYDKKGNHFTIAVANYYGKTKSK